MPPEMYPPPITTIYPSTTGNHTVTTPWNGRDDAQEWWNRHKDQVRADMAGSYPLVVAN